MNRNRGPQAIKVRSAQEWIFIKKLLAQTTELPQAMLRLLAGPPMTERERFNRNVAEARSRTDWLRLR